MRAFIKFNKGLMKASLYVRVWLVVLVLANLVVPLFYLRHVEAQWVLAAFLAGAILMTLLTGRSGFTRLLGLGHIFWIPLLWFLWTRLGENPSNSFYGFWLRAVLVLNAVSLVIDVMDVVRYIAGDRAETVKGL